LKNRNLLHLLFSSNPNQWRNETDKQLRGTARKCLDTVSGFLPKYKHIEGWRKISHWRREIKGLMRELGKSSALGGQNKQAKVAVSTE